MSESRQHPLSIYINYLSQCFHEDNTTYINEFIGNYYSFKEWYFLYRKKRVYKFNNKMKYKLTPRKLDIITN